MGEEIMKTVIGGSQNNPNSFNEIMVHKNIDIFFLRVIAIKLKYRNVDYRKSSPSLAKKRSSSNYISWIRYQ